MKTITQLTKERILLNISTEDEYEAERAIEAAIFEGEKVYIKLYKPIHLKTLTDRLSSKILIIEVTEG